MTTTPEIDARHRKEVADAYVAVDRLRLAAKISAVIGALAFVWTLIAMTAGSTPADEGMLFLAGTALGTIVPAAGLYAASYRMSLGVARLERALDGDWSRASAEATSWRNDRHEGCVTDLGRDRRAARSLDRPMRCPRHNRGSSASAHDSTSTSSSTESATISS